MSVTSIDLLRFILGLLGDPAKAQAFTDDPNAVMAAAGLSGVTCADVDAITPLIANSAPGAVAISYTGTVPGEMIQHIVQNIAVSSYDNSGVVQNIWSNGDVRQAFASEGGLALGGDLNTDDPIVVGDGNIIAADTATAAGRDIIQNQADGNLALGGDQTIAQDSGVISGGDSIAQGDKVGGNNNEAENTGNDNSVSVGGNQNNAENTGNDNSVSVGGNQNNAEGTGNASSSTTNTTTNHDESVSVGGNQNNAEGTGNTSSSTANTTTNTTTNHDESVTVGDVDLSQTVSVGGNQNNAEGTGNTSTSTTNTSTSTTTNTSTNTSTNHDESVSVTVGDVDLSENMSVGGDYWENGSNVGGIGNTDNRNSGNTSDSGNTVALTENNDNSINVGTVAVDLSQHTATTSGDTVTNLDNSVDVGGVVLTDDHSVTLGDVTVTDDHSVTTGDANITDDHSVTVGDVTVTDDHSVTSGDAYTADDHSITEGASYEYTYDNHSVGGNFYEQGGGSSYGDYYEQGSGNVSADTTVGATTTATNDYDYTYGA